MQINDKALEDFNRLCELAEKEEVPNPMLGTIHEGSGSEVPPPNT
jgi:hypothetical protein